MVGARQGFKPSMCTNSVVHKLLHTRITWVISKGPDTQATPCANDIRIAGQQEF